MAQLESSFKNMVVVLTIIAVFAAGTLASVYTLTKAPIAASKIAKQQQAIKEVMPSNFHHLANPITLTEGDETITIHKGYDLNNQYVGAAVESSTNSGFSGRILVMVGFDVNGNILNYTVLEQKETPGLGTKMVDWFKTDKGNQSIIGKNPAINNLTVNKDGGEVDAITASTITTRAFLITIRNAYAALMSTKDNASVSVNKGSTTN